MATSKEAKQEETKNVQVKIQKLLKALADPIAKRHEKCRLRGQLRRLGHYGGLRARTYTDQTSGKTIVVEKKAKKSA